MRVFGRPRPRRQDSIGLARNRGRFPLDQPLVFRRTRLATSLPPHGKHRPHSVAPLDHDQTVGQRLNGELLEHFAPRLDVFYLSFVTDQRLGRVFARSPRVPVHESHVEF